MATTVLAAISAACLGYAIAGLAAVTAPRLVAGVLVARRLRVVERQLPAALDGMASALRAGQSVPQAIGWVAREGPDPIAAEFRWMTREMELGRTFEDALGQLAERLPTQGVKALAMVVPPLRGIGANLIPVLEGIGDVLRRRASAAEKLAGLTAQGRMQLWVMGLMMPVLVLIIYRLEPELIGRLFSESRGRLVLFAAVGLEGLGLLLARRFLDPKQMWN